MDPVTLPIPWFPSHSNLLGPSSCLKARHKSLPRCHVSSMCHPLISPIRGWLSPSAKLRDGFLIMFFVLSTKGFTNAMTREKGKPCLFHHALDPQMSSKDDIMWQDVVKSQTGILFKLKLDAARIQSQKNLCTGLRRLRLFSHSCLIGCSAARLQGWELLEMRVFQKFKTSSVFYQ